MNEETKTKTGSLAEALAALQGELPTITKNKTGKISGTSARSGNEFNFEYRYADLAEVVEKVGPLASKHGLSFSSKPTNTEHGFVLAYALRHGHGVKKMRASGRCRIRGPTIRSRSALRSPMHAGMCTPQCWALSPRKTPT